MRRKRFVPEKIISMLREAEVGLSQGLTVGKVCRRLEISEQTYYRWRINHKRVEKIWRHEGLKVPKKQPKSSRLWLNDGSCVRLRPTNRNHVWSYDFVMDRTHNGRPIKILTVIDEYGRECLAINVGNIDLTKKGLQHIVLTWNLRFGIATGINILIKGN
ncbi:MAG: transposase [Proteobacteria bacterium]|nr:transposase [Pseudomonadota bacterium]